MLLSGTGKVNVRSRITGSIAGHVIAAARAYYAAEKKTWAEVEKNIELPVDAHELDYQKYTADHYIQNGGRLNLLSLGLVLLGTGWAFERAQELLPEEIAELERMAEAYERFKATPGAVLDYVPLRSLQLGGPGSSVHIGTLSYIHYNAVETLFKEAFWVGRVMHRLNKVAVSACQVTADALRLSIIHGNDPSAILFQLNEEIVLLSQRSNGFPVVMIDAMGKIGNVFRQNIDAAEGLKLLEKEILKAAVFKGETRTKAEIGARSREVRRYKRSALVVVPKGIYLAMKCTTYEEMLDVLDAETAEKMAEAEQVEDAAEREHEIKMQKDSCYKLGAHAGSVKGAMVGLDGIPNEWIRNLETGDTWLTTAERLFLLVTVGQS